jgi:FAD/FMN-containing dehydrogenase
MTSAGAVVTDAVLEDFSGNVRGVVITDADAEFATSIGIWNAYFQKIPGAILRAQGASDVMKAVDFARDNDIVLAVRGGGHCFSGTGSCAGGLVIDTSAMRGITVDPQRKTVLAQPGVTQGDFDAETNSFGLAVTGSQESYIGIGGLTLGGGLGWLARYRGLLSDNLIAADVVLASGELRRASATDDAELFWAIRGGGGNFGVATSFEFQLYEQGPCMAGLLAFPVAEAPDVARRLDEFNRSAPDELTTSFAFLTAPDGQPAIGLGFVHAEPGPGVDKEVVEPMRGMGSTRLLDVTDMMPYVAVQRMLDENTVAGHRYYPRSFLFDELQEDAIRVLAEGFVGAPERTLVGGGLMGGVMAKLGPTATAFPHRTGYLTSILTCWTDPAKDEEAVAWTEEVYEKLLPYTVSGVYANHLGSDSAERIAEAYGPNYERLTRLKARYDPDNFFHTNNNIIPAE